MLRFLRDHPVPVYQWIPGKRPQSNGPLKDRLNLEYRASEDPYQRHRAIEIVRPSTELGGEYRCKVSSFENDSQAQATMVVFGKSVFFCHYYYFDMFKIRKECFKNCFSLPFGDVLISNGLFCWEYQILHHWERKAKICSLVFYDTLCLLVKLFWERKRKKSNFYYTPSRAACGSCVAIDYFRHKPLISQTKPKNHNNPFPSPSRSPLFWYTWARSDNWIFLWFFFSAGWIVCNTKEQADDIDGKRNLPRWRNLSRAASRIDSRRWQQQVRHFYYLLHSFY